MTYPAIPDRPPNALPFDIGGIEPLPPKWSAPTADAPLSDLWQQLTSEGIKVTCTSAACDRDLHCFKLTQKQAKLLAPGSCRECRVTFVSMGRTARRDLADVDYTFAALQREMIRHRFWHIPFGDKALTDAFRRGPDGLRDRVPTVLRSRIGRAQPFRDGWQTPTDPTKTTAIDLAMHAVAACCRRCVEYWHSIPMGADLTESEITYLGGLVQRYLTARLSGVAGWPGDGHVSANGAEIHSLPRALQTITIQSTLKAS